MPDATPDQQTPDSELAAEAACCPGGACGPIFETSLVELAFNRVRRFVRSRSAADVVDAAPDPLLDQVPSTAPAVAAPPPRPQKDAPHD